MTTLLLIDAQIDFHPGGSLAVTNSDKDAERTASLIRASISDPSSPNKINRIIATLDSHHKLDIAHPHFWISPSNKDKHPDPFTLITHEDIASKKWIPRPDLKFFIEDMHVVPEIFKVDQSELYDEDGYLDVTLYCLEYTKRLESSEKFVLCIWPEHCLIGSPGHGIVNIIREAMDEWSLTTGKKVEWVWKGQNTLTEMYSSFQAEVEISPKTSMNMELIKSLSASDRILVCGQALSHCVNYTARHLIDNMPGSEGKICLLRDCSSSVTGFEAAGEEFVRYVEEKGGNVCSDSETIFGKFVSEKKSGIVNTIVNTIADACKCM